MSDLKRDGLQEVRRQGAKGLSVTQRAKINRRQFLTGAFRGRNVALSRTEVTSALPGRDFTTPETAPQIPDWDDGIDSVLEEMENLKGIEDF